MARKDLLSEAIADAKAVKETAMANAKLALEEAFTPKLQSMISAKLAEEAEEEMEEDETEEAYHSEEAEVEEYKEAEMDSEEEMEEAEMDSEEEVEMEEEEEMEMDSEEDEDELDLESIIRELEDENEMDSEEEVEMTEEDDMEMDSEEEEEEIDLDEVIRTLKEMEDGDEEEEEAMTEAEEEDEDMAGELEEAYTTIKSLQTTINEVNLLNAKLLYTNKLFRTFDLNENQKVKVLENFDRTSSVREVKLVFSTLAENLNVAKKTKVVVREGYASKATKSSAPKKKIISEGNELAARWKKLAGLI
tara:strand:+ start:1021 stop:1935 length:915 start_codon:yes stop_codon:yes gene_type:complete